MNFYIPTSLVLIVILFFFPIITNSEMQLRPSAERGYANHGWLKTHHTFSFASYKSERFQGFESLRVINEDYVQEGKGFALHPHQNYEIFSYIISGVIIHKDSMKNAEECKRGDIQFTSAGTGIYHSEYAKVGAGELHFLQIWVKPDTLNLPPGYATAHFTEEQKLNRLCPLLLPPPSFDSLNSTSLDDRLVSDTDADLEVNSAITIHQDIRIFASILELGYDLSYRFSAGRKGYIHVIEKNDVHLVVSLSNHDDNDDNNNTERYELFSGDGLYVLTSHSIHIESLSSTPVEFLLFDILEFP